MHGVPVDRVYRGRADAQEHAVVGDDRFVDLSKLQNVRGPIPVLDDGFHRVHLPLSRHAGWRVRVKKL